MEAYKREFIQFLENAGVLKFGDFTAKSGRKIPYFINAGMIKTGSDIATLGEFYAKAYFEKLGKKQAVLYGPAYKGISLSVSAAVALSKQGLNVPFFFNRKEVKDHGEGGVFVGYVPVAGEEIVIIEDVITAGTAIRESMEILSHLEGTKVAATFIMVDRKEKGQPSLWLTARKRVRPTRVRCRRSRSSSASPYTPSLTYTTSSSILRKTPRTRKTLPVSRITSPSTAQRHKAV